ncbi:MAG: DNA polymerase IV [Planctomycetes bacterium]|nr:DNA polymerase IV [Planctomycetota bacterium]
MADLVFHVDIDAFFASVEQLLIPRLRRRPVAVGNGVIASCSYEARALGLHAGMPLWRAKRQCPHLVITDGQQAIYRCFADQIWAICRRYATAVETFLDEAYGDAAGMTGVHGPPEALGLALRRAIVEEVGLSVAVGLADNRMLAKLAGKSVKPGGVRWVGPEEAPSFLAPLPAASLPGVGHRTAAELADLNIATVGDLRRLTRADLRGLFGRRGEVLYERCRGRDVHPAGAGVADERRRRPQSISRETTFHEPTGDPGQIRAMLFYLLERAMRAVRQAGLAARTVEVTLRYDDWKSAAMRKSLPEATVRDADLYEAVLSLLRRLHTRRVQLRHVGVVLSGLGPADASGTLFDTPAETADRKLHAAVDAIRDRWGHAAVVKGDSIELLGRLRQDDNGFVLRTPSLTK